MQMLYYNHISLIVYNTLTTSAVVSYTFAIIKYEGMTNFLSGIFRVNKSSQTELPLL